MKFKKTADDTWLSELLDATGKNRYMIVKKGALFRIYEHEPNFKIYFPKSYPGSRTLKDAIRKLDEEFGY